MDKNNNFYTRLIITKQFSNKRNNVKLFFFVNRAEGLSFYHPIYINIRQKFQIALSQTWYCNAIVQAKEKKDLSFASSAKCKFISSSAICIVMRGLITIPRRAARNSQWGGGFFLLAQ